MNFEETVEDGLFRYPSLWFGDKWYEYRLLNHLFFVIGNGFEWENGELAYWCGEEQKKQTWQHFLREVLEEIDRFPKRRAFFAKINAKRGKNTKKTAEFRFYPFSEGHSMAFLVPEDVKQDWLEGVIHFLEFATTRPLESFYHDYDKWTEEQEIEHALKMKEKVQKQLKKLKEQHKRMYG